MDLFCDTTNPESKPLVFSDYVALNDVVGAMCYLQKCSKEQIVNEVARAGFTLIGWHHGKKEVLDYIANQLAKKCLSLRGTRG